MSVETETQKEAERLFFEGYNCAQSVFGALAGSYGIDQEMAMKLSASFGGGMGRMREVCGTVSGMLLAAGLETGATEGNDRMQKAYNYQMVQKVIADFKEENGSIICRELLGINAKQVEKESHIPEERTEDYYRKRPCVRLVKIAVRIFEENFLK